NYEIKIGVHVIILLDKTIGTYGAK